MVPHNNLIITVDISISLGHARTSIFHNKLTSEVYKCSDYCTVVLWHMCTSHIMITTFVSGLYFDIMHWTL